MNTGSQRPGIFMDNFLLQAVVTELESVLIGHKPGRIFQIGSTDLLIDLNLRDGRLLHISADPLRLTLNLTTRTHRQFNDEPRNDTQFVSTLKKHISGSRLISIEKLGYDRVVHFRFGDGVTMVVSLTGRSANCLLVLGDGIIASLRNRDADSSEYVDPPPPSDRLDPFQCTPETLEQLIRNENGDVAAAIEKHMIGFTAMYAGEISARSSRSPVNVALTEMLSELSERRPAPALYCSPGIEQLRRTPGIDEATIIVSIIPLESQGALERTPFPGVNEAVDIYVRLLDERRNFLERRRKVQADTSVDLKRERKLLANLRRELEGFSASETHQRFGELLLAGLHNAGKQGDNFLVTDLYDEAQPPIKIPSAGKATAREAAEHYFRLARKARHGREVIEGRIPSIEAKISELEQKLVRIAKSISPADLQGIQGSTPRSPQKRASERSGRQNAQKDRISGVRRYRSTDGYEILVGRTDRDNDNLTLRIAKSFDLWFHAADYPGSHVVLRNPARKDVPARAITQAAQLAAKFSQAGGDAKVAVNYCEKKFVTKPKGFAPGQVRLSSFKTILVEPAEAGERI